MKHHLLTAGLALGALLPLGAVKASGDYGCTLAWKLDSDTANCADSAVLSPGNDSRVNLLFLLRDRAGVSAIGLPYPEREYSDFGYGRTFFDWSELREAFYPRPKPADEDSQGEFEGLRCASVAASTPAFEAAVRAARGLSPAERDSLVAARGKLAETCRGNAGGDWPAGIASTTGQEFLAYLKAADAFYADRWDEARAGFAALRQSRDKWLAETAAYMAARTDLATAQASAIDDWGSVDAAKLDRAAIARAQQALTDYLKAWPKGRYADSARGLVRRGYWFAADWRNLAREYEGLLARVDAAGEAAPQLVQEIDNKLLFASGAEGAVDGPLLLATLDLLIMRPEEIDVSEEAGGETDENGGGDEASAAPAPAPRPVLTAAALEAQRPVFASRPELFAFLQATHAFYVAKDMRRVLALIPADAGRAPYGALAFSRQVLRGLALAALKDPGEPAHWQGLLAGSTALYQRPAVELGLAMSWERAGRLSDVFAPTSPIGDVAVRAQLLQHAAGPDLLRAVARRTDRPARERAIAMLTLLYKQLTRGDYAGFVRNVALVPAGANTDGGLYDLDRQADIPIGLFAAGRWSDAYPCPALAQTAATLAARPRDPKARLCLGEFYRLNGFDDFAGLNEPPDKDRLGGAADLFPGRPVPRGRFYAEIMNDGAAGGEERAYALYRAVRCYAPSGNNSCGGEDVGIEQRRAWFQRLKREYAASRWARELKFYW